MSVKPIYHCTNSELLIVCGTIIKSAIDNKAAIIAKRPKWADPYFENFQNKIQAAKSKYSGLDSAKDLRSSTVDVKSIMSQVKVDLSEFHGDLAIDYKDDTSKHGEILTTLGFNKYYKFVTGNNQEGTISLLDQFNKNLTPALEADIIDKGMSAELITRVKSYSDQLSTAELTQENAKNKRPGITVEAVKEFNSIYSDTIDVCKVGQRIFKDDETKKNLFVFSKTLAAIRGGNRSGGNGEGETTPPPGSK